MKKINFKFYMGAFIGLLGLVFAILFAVQCIVIGIRNVDMTKMRLFMTYPLSPIGVTISLLVNAIGFEIVKRS